MSRTNERDERAPSRKRLFALALASLGAACLDHRTVDSGNSAASGGETTGDSGLDSGPPPATSRGGGPPVGGTGATGTSTSPSPEPLPDWPCEDDPGTEPIDGKLVFGADESIQRYRATDLLPSVLFELREGVGWQCFVNDVRRRGGVHERSIPPSESRKSVSIIVTVRKTHALELLARRDVEFLSAIGAAVPP